MTDTTYTDDMNLDDDQAPGETEAEEYDLASTEFDLEADYKEDPLAPQGTYNGIVKLVEYVPKIHAIVWTVVAVENPGITLMDGETPVDGIEFQCNNWLPKKGDENIRSKGGKSTKRQNKINSIKRFQDDMQVDMNTPEKVANSIEENEWIGIPVVFQVKIDTYEGRTRNTVGNMKRADRDFEMPEGIPSF